MTNRPFVFIRVSQKMLERVGTYGMDLANVQIYPTLKQARAGKGVVLVVSRKAVEKGALKPKHIKNALPFRRAVRLVAGGGILVRPGADGPEIVLIFRRGKWDLPKGKQDRGETKRECAVREVSEELGIPEPEILSKLGTTVHGYRARKRRYAVKTTHWYAMRTTATEFVPQAKERITDARWVPLDEAIDMLGYKPLIEFLVEVRRTLNGLA